MTESQQWYSDGPMWDNDEDEKQDPSRVFGDPQLRPLTATEERLMSTILDDPAPGQDGNEPRPLSQCLPAVLAEMIKREAKRGDC